MRFRESACGRHCASRCEGDGRGEAREGEGGKLVCGGLCTPPKFELYPVPRSLEQM